MNDLFQPAASSNAGSGSKVNKRRPARKDGAA